MRPFGIARLRGPLVYPGTEALGFDPTHPLATRCLVSLVAVNGGILSLLDGQVAAATGAPACKLDANIGEGLAFTSTQKFALSNLPVLPSAASSAIFTYAGILRLPATVTSSHLIISTGDTGAIGTGFFIGSGRLPSVLKWGGTASAFSTALLASTAYFVVISVNGTTTANLCVVNLLTGQIITEATAGLAGGSPAASASTWPIGNTAGTRPFLGNIAAAMYSSAFYNMQTLLAAAADPWSFWYPQVARNDGPSPPAGGPSFNPAWGGRSNYSHQPGVQSP